MHLNSKRQDVLIYISFFPILNVKFITISNDTIHNDTGVVGSSNGAGLPSVSVRPSNLDVHSFLNVIFLAFSTQNSLFVLVYRKTHITHSNLDKPLAAHYAGDVSIIVFFHLSVFFFPLSERRSDRLKEDNNKIILLSGRFTNTQTAKIQTSLGICAL